MDFLSLLKTDVKKYVQVRKVSNKSDQEVPYVAWTRIVQMAGRPRHATATFHHGDGAHSIERGYRSFFGGSVVAVDMDIGTGESQRVYLPVLGKDNNPVPAGKETSRHVGDALSRCVARAIAMVHGLGLTVYDGRTSTGEPLHQRWFGDGETYAHQLGVTPETDLALVTPMLDMKSAKDSPRKTPYLGWHAAIAACRITDPTFFWEVIEVDSVDHTTGEVLKLPAMNVAEGYMVGVKIRYKGQMCFPIWLPIMETREVQTRKGPKVMEHQPATHPDVFQWHSAVMRCLSKAIAINTGYGLSAYSDMEAGEGDPTLIEAKIDLIQQVEQGVDETKTDMNTFMRFFKVSSLESASYERLQAMLNGIKTKKSLLARQANLRKEIKGVLENTSVNLQSVLSELKVSSLESANVEQLQRVLKALAPPPPAANEPGVSPEKQEAA